MKRKSPAGKQRSPAKVNKTQVLGKRSGRLLQMTSKTKGTPSSSEDPIYMQAVQHYQDGLRALQERKFEKAKGLFQKVTQVGQRDLADRAKVHLNTCMQRLEQSRNVFQTPEEHYDYAVSLINLGDYVSAREHLEKILKETPRADYAWYGTAVLECLTGHYEDSLKALTEAIRLNGGNRYQARNDSDFKNLADDPRFTELLYPETGSEFTPASSGFRR